MKIYNENIRDLLGNDGDETIKHEIKKVSREDNDIYVTDLTEVDVCDEQQVANLLARAATNRAVARTDMNERSSRSHSVFRMLIVGNNSHTGDDASPALMRRGVVPCDAESGRPRWLRAPCPLWRHGRTLEGDPGNSPHPQINT